MANAIHPAAPHHLPVFITAPGESDVFMIACAIFLVLAVLGLGSLYFRLHSLPEHLAHGNASKLQFEVVAVLALLALFTHNNWFWVAALLLALVPIPDIYAPLAGMAESLAKMAGWRLPGREVPPGAAPAEIAWRIPPATGTGVQTGRTGSPFDVEPSPASGDGEQALPERVTGKRPDMEPKEGREP